MSTALRTNLVSVILSAFLGPVATFAATGWIETSEEGHFADITCDPGYAATGAWCSGSNCDNVWLHCGYVGGSFGGNYWTGSFSEEGTYWRDCGPGYAVTGLSCSGGYCDNVNVQCTHTGSLLSNDCDWTQWFSEEQGGFFFESGRVARGVACRGGNCDDMMYYTCRKN